MEFFNMQKFTLQELENKLNTLSIKVDDLSTTQHSNTNHILQEKIEFLTHEQDTFKTRLLTTQQSLETTKSDLMTEMDKMEKMIQRQLSTQENRLLTNLTTIEHQVETAEHSLSKLSDKQTLEAEKHLESLSAIQLKVRGVEYEIQKSQESLTRLETRLQTTETDLLHTVETKTQILEQRLLTLFQQHKLETTSQHSETAAKVQLIQQKVDFLTTHYENKYTQMEGKIDENYATQSRLFVEGEATHQSHHSHACALVEELKTDFTTHLSTIALQQEQLSQYIEKLDLTTSQKTLLLETEGIATRNITKAEISKVAKGLNEVCEELKFDVSHVNNRLMILEQQVNFADASVASTHQQQQQPSPQQVQQQQMQADAKVLATIQKSLASQQEQLQVLQEELVTLDTNHSNQNGKIDAIQGQLQQLQQAQQQLLQAQQMQQAQLQRSSSSNSISYAAESKQAPSRSSPPSPKPGAVSGPPISAIAAFMSPQQQPHVKTLNPAVARAMAADPRVMTQSAAPAAAVADAKGPASSSAMMLTPAKPSAPSSRSQQQQVHHHGAVLLSPMTTASTSATTSAANASGGGASSSSLHPSPPSAVKNASNVSPRPRLSPPVGVAAASASVGNTVVTKPVARRFHPNQEEEEEVEGHDHTKQQQQPQQQMIDERNFESDDEDAPLQLLDEVMKMAAGHHGEDAGPETSSISPTSHTSALHLTKAAPPSSTVMTSAASFPKTPPKHLQRQSKADTDTQERLSIETMTAVAAPIPIQPFSPAQPAPQLQRTLSAGSNSSNASSASKFSRRFNEASMTPPPTNSSRRSDSFDEDEAAHMLSSSFEGIALHLGSGMEDEHEFVSDSESENERSGFPGSALKPTVFTGVAASTVNTSDTVAESKIALDTAEVRRLAAEPKANAGVDVKLVLSSKPVEVKDAEAKVPQVTTVDHIAATNPASGAAAGAESTSLHSTTASSGTTAAAAAPAVIVSGSLLGRGGGIQRK